MQEIAKESIDKEFDNYMRGRQYDDIDGTDGLHLVLNIILPLFLKARKSNLTEVQELKYIIIGMQDRYNKSRTEELISKSA